MTTSARLIACITLSLAALGQTHAPIRQDPTHAAESAWAKNRRAEIGVIR